MSNNLVVVPLQDMQVMAETMSKSKMFGLANADQALALMLLCQAEGLHPAQAVRDYHVIAGKPTLKTDAMLSKFQNAGGKVEWLIYTDTEVKGKFSHPQGGTLTLSWTIEQAKRAGLATKDVWRQYPRAMLRARVVSEGIRTIFPAVLGGMYTPEEVQDFDAKPQRNTGKPVEKVIEGEVLQKNSISGPIPAPAPFPIETYTEITQLAQEQHVDILSSLLFQIDACETMDCLKQHYTHAMSVLKDDKEGMKQVYDMKNTVKARIESKMRDEAEEV